LDLSKCFRSIIKYAVLYIFITEENTFNLAGKEWLGFTYILLCVN